MMQRRHTALCATSLCTVSLLLAACSGNSGGNAATDAGASNSVQVQTVQVRRQALDETLTLYGQVVHDTGAVENISFASPVLVSRLLVRAGEPVKRNQVLLEVVTDPNASGAFVQAQTALDLAQGELQRTRELANEKLATQSQLAAARKELSDAQTALAVQRKLGAAPGTQKVRASRAGMVSSLSVQQGDRVAAGITALQVSGAGAQHALLGAEPGDVALLVPGMEVRLTPVFGGAPVAARISQVFGVIDPQTQLMDVSVRIDSKGKARALTPSLKVRGDIVLRSPTLFMLPRAAVLTDTNGAYLFQVADGHARRVGVQMRIETADRVGVDGPVDPKLPVVVSGNYELDDGVPVRSARKPTSQSKTP